VSHDLRRKGLALGNVFLVYRILDTFCYLSVKTAVRSVVLTQYRCVTDGQTDRWTEGIALAITAPATRALQGRRCKKNVVMNDSPFKSTHHVCTCCICCFGMTNWWLETPFLCSGATWLETPVLCLRAIHVGSRPSLVYIDTLSSTKCDFRVSPF